MGKDAVLKYESYLQHAPKEKVLMNTKTNNKRMEKDLKEQHSDRYYCLESLEGDYKELYGRYSYGLHCENIHSKSFENLGPSQVLRRGSMYQSSEEVMNMRKVKEERRKIDSSCIGDAFLSFDIVESLAHSDINEVGQFTDEKHQNLVFSNSELKSSTTDRSQSISSRSEDFLKLSFRKPHKKSFNFDDSSPDFLLENVTSAVELSETYLQTNSPVDYTKAAPDLVESKCSKKNEHDGKFEMEGFNAAIDEKDPLHRLSRKFPVKDKKSSEVLRTEHGVPNSSCNPQVSPLENMLDPTFKSKYVQTSLLMETENCGTGVTDNANIKRNGKFRKSLLTDFSTTKNKSSFHENLMGEGMAITFSPAHLHGILKVKSQNGNPSFEFCVQDPGDDLSAKSWRTGNSFNWVYTFHNSRKKIISSRGTKDKHRQTSRVIGQMQVSCHLYSEVKESESFVDSLVTQFVSYDNTQARRKFSTEERSQCSSNSIQPLTSNDIDFFVKEEPSDGNNCREHGTSVRNDHFSFGIDTSVLYPRSFADLHPQHEIAAIMIQMPLKKKENMKDFKEVIRKEKQSSSYSPTIMKVITPSGTHGLPDNDENGPSSLIERWRFSGGPGECDCGGWDMGCPIFVFDDRHPDDCAYHSPSESQKPMLLFLQGSKEKLPALSMTADGKGQYVVDFHARLSTLQAFSICIAILHKSEVSSPVIQENNLHRLHSSSLKLLEKEVRHLMEVVATEEKKKLRSVTDHTQSFFLDPPLSPISRV